MSHRLRTALVSAFTLLLGSNLSVAEERTPPPPQYLTAPLHAPEQIQALINGRLTFAASKKPGGGGGGGGGTGSTSTATFSLTAQTAGTQTDVVGRLASYQGETAITKYAGGWVGGFNSIYPGQCSAALANCAPGATMSPTGVSWSTSSIPIVGNLIGFDPSLSADANGTIYYGYGVCSGSCSSANAMVATSTNGVNWTAHTVTPPQTGIFDDKYWVAADPNPARAGRAYMAWDRNKGNNQLLLVSRTTDSGNTWSSPVKINDGTSPFERVIYAMPAVDPTNGTVYVVWIDYARKALYVDKSTDGGATWGTDVSAASLNATFTDIGCNGGRSMAAAPYIAVDSQGWVYVTYADIKGSTGMDVYLVYSKNGGQNWQGPYRLNDVATGHQYNPAMSVVGNGQVHVSWLDRRDDAQNCLTHAYSTYSNGVFAADGTPQFSANQRLTNAASNFDGNSNGPGDYSGTIAYPTANSTAALPFFPTHLSSDVASESGQAGGFEAYVTGVQP